MKSSSKSQREINEINSSKNIKTADTINQTEKISIAISENYQAFLSLIYLIIGCSFLFYLFSFVFSIYVSI